MDRKWQYGFCWAQPHLVKQGILENTPYKLMMINSQKIPSEYGGLAEMTAADAVPSSHHPGGVNAAFVAGNVKLLNERIDPLVYAQLMTSNRRTSELVQKVGDNLIPEAELAQPDDGDY